MVLSGLLLGMTIVLETYALASHRVPTGADQSIVALMARHILHGEHPVFYWGATYAGSLEPHYVALLFAAFGSSMRVYHVAMGILVIALVAGAAAWAARTFGIVAGLFCLVYFALPPFFLLYKGLTSDGAYDSVALLSLGQIAIATSIDLARAGRASRARLFALGLLTGGAFWVMPHTAAFSAAVLAWVWFRKNVLRKPGAAAALIGGIVVGSCPWWIWNLRHHWASLRTPEMGAVSLGRAFRNLVLLLSGSVPALEGGMSTSPWPEFFHPLFSGSRMLAILAILLVVALSVRRAAAGSSADRLLLAGLGAILVAASFSARLVPYEPRYLMGYYVLFPPLFGAALAGLLRREHGAVAAVAAAGVLALHGGSIASARVRNQNLERDVAGDLRPLIEHLAAEGLDRVYANYWTAYRLAFESGERIIASPLPMDQATRYAPFLQSVDAAADPAFVLLEPRDSCLGEFLRERGLPFARFSVGDFGVYLKIPASVLASVRGNHSLPLPDTAYRVDWRSIPAVRSLQAGGTRAVRIGYRNAGPCIWPITVHVSYHWLPVDPGRPAVFENPRGFPPGPLDPGREADVMLPLTAPGAPGSYRLQWELVHEGVEWFSRKGGKTVEVPFTVVPSGSTP